MNEKSTLSIRAYIENAHDTSIGGFTIPLPTTKEALQPWLDAIGAGGLNENDIAILELRSSMPGLEDALHDLMDAGTTFDEINYLAAKISSLDKRQAELFTAALETEYFGVSMKELINLTENLNLLDLQPAFSEEQYGEFQIQMEKDNLGDVFERLENSDDPEEREFAQYVLRSEAAVDAKASKPLPATCSIW